MLSETTDEETNALVWKYLGYRYDEETGEWDASAVFPKWAKKYPQPPDLIGARVLLQTHAPDGVVPGQADKQNVLFCIQH